MSSILKALKKLEEEKKSIDDTISLKEINLHGENVEYKISIEEKLAQWRGRIFLILAGILLGGLLGKFF